MRLAERFAPRCWTDIVGQQPALDTIDRLRKTGLGGRAFFLSGPSGCGKTSIARLLAAELADPIATDELDAGLVTPAQIVAISKGWRVRPLGSKGGWAYIVNEAHGLVPLAVRQFLTTLDPPGGMPKYVIWIFTSTIEGTGLLFDKRDGGPLLSRCEHIELAAPAELDAAIRLKQVAEQCQLDGQDVSAYVRLYKGCRGNLRECFGKIESGYMLGGAR